MKVSTSDAEKVQELKIELTRFMMVYKFALDEMNTKIDILKQEFTFIHDYNPIEHVKSRVKTPESILKKVNRKGYPLTLASVKENIHDIAGIRITCSFISDIYRISDMLQKQKDVVLIEAEDYIKNPKPNGYKSLHLLLQVPVFMTDREEKVCIELQIRTIAMDFWASLEHKIYYKYDKEVPESLLEELRMAAETVSELDKKMEHIHIEMNEVKEEKNGEEVSNELVINNDRFPLPLDLLQSLLQKILEK